MIFLFDIIFFLLGGSNLQFIDFSTISWLIHPLHFKPYSDKKFFSQQAWIVILFSFPIRANSFAILICSSFVGGLKSGAFLFTFSYKSKKLIVQLWVYSFNCLAIFSKHLICFSTSKSLFIKIGSYLHPIELLVSYY